MLSFALIHSLQYLTGDIFKWVNINNRLIEPPGDIPFLALISGVSYYPAGLFSKKTKST